MLSAAKLVPHSYTVAGALLALSALGCGGGSDDTSAAGGNSGSGGATSGGGGAPGGGATSGGGGATSGGGGATSGGGGSPGGGGSGGQSSACANLKGEGHAVNQIAENWTLKDRNGADVSLYDYCGNVIFIEDGAEW